MEKFFDVMKNSRLFAGIDDKDLNSMLSCLGARTADFRKGSFIFNEGDPAACVGMVLCGNVQIMQEDYFGNRSLLSAIGPGEIFGEMFACADIDSLPVSAAAATDCTVMLMDIKRMLRVCTGGCAFHNMLVENLLRSVARKTLALSGKIRYMSRKTTREKLLSYLTDIAKSTGSDEFVIPYDRQGLADFLGVERSAMSAELGKLKKEGIIDTKGSAFRILRR